MDIEFELGDLKFVWDSEKAEINWKKHKVRFEDAALVFFDENLIDEFDEFHSDFEDRIKIIGRINGILAVIYTERNDRNRIISARQATKREEVKYIMNNFIINGVEVSEEQYNRIKNMRRIPDEEIDFSDIPETTPEEWERVKLRRLRKRNLKVAG